MNDENKVKILKTAMNVFLLLAICIINGCFDFLKWQFHFERLLTIVFWIKTLAKFVTLVCAKNVGMNLFEDIKRKLNENLQENKKRYERLNSFRCSDFSIWVETVFNPRIKKEKYISMMNKSIAKLEKHTNPRYRLLYVHNEEEREKIIESYLDPTWKKKANEYLEKRKKLDLMLQDDFIDKNINSMDIKCENINPAVFDLTIDAKMKTKTYRVTSHLAPSKLGALIVSSAFMVVGQMIIATIGYSFDKDEAMSQAEKMWNAILNTMMDLSFIAWQFFCGTREIGKIIEQQEGIAYANRCYILKTYLLETGKISDENKLEKICEILDKKAS